MREALLVVRYARRNSHKSGTGGAADTIDLSQTRVNGPSAVDARHACVEARTDAVDLPNSQCGKVFKYLSPSNINLVSA